MMNRRNFTAATGLLLVSCRAPASPRKVVDSDPFVHKLRQLESGSGGRLGVHLLDTASGAELGHRSDERFLMCSTFKLLACGYALRRVDRGQDSLDRRIAYGAADLVPWSPITERHVAAGGMTLGELCHATLTTSDNTAANLILASYGGPAALTAFARSIGDSVTRLDRFEPALNTSRDDSDTTSPRAMLHTMRRLVLDDALTPPSREQLKQWLQANTTGDRRLRAGVPSGWVVGDKTGTSGKGTSNDIGIVWPPDGRAPLLVTVYLTRSTASPAAQDATIAQVGRLVAAVAAGQARPLQR